MNASTLNGVGPVTGPAAPSQHRITVDAEVDAAGQHHHVRHEQSRGCGNRLVAGCGGRLQAGHADDDTGVQRCRNLPSDGDCSRHALPRSGLGSTGCCATVGKKGGVGPGHIRGRLAFVQVLQLLKIQRSLGLRRKPQLLTMDPARQARQLSAARAKRGWVSSLPCLRKLEQCRRSGALGRPGFISSNWRGSMTILPSIVKSTIRNRSIAMLLEIIARYAASGTCGRQRFS